MSNEKFVIEVSPESQVRRIDQEVTYMYVFMQPTLRAECLLTPDPKKASIYERRTLAETAIKLYGHEGMSVVTLEDANHIYEMSNL